MTDALDWIKPQTRLTRIGDLSKNDVIVVEGKFVEVSHAHFCNGTNEPLAFIAGKDFRTTAALRVFLTDGTNFITHLDAKVLRA